jgi:hypothetical protein
MEILEGRDYFLYVYHHVAIIILQQLLFFVDFLKIPVTICWYLIIVAYYL